jgi:hypothetical protein
MNTDGVLVVLHEQLEDCERKERERIREREKREKKICQMKRIWEREIYILWSE